MTNALQKKSDIYEQGQTKIKYALYALNANGSKYELIGEFMDISWARYKMNNVYMNLRDAFIAHYSTDEDVALTLELE